MLHFSLIIVFFFRIEHNPIHISGKSGSPPCFEKWVNTIDLIGNLTSPFSHITFHGEGGCR